MMLRTGFAVVVVSVFCCRAFACDVDNPPRLFGQLQGSLPNTGDWVKLWVQNGYLPALPVLVRVELRTAGGDRDWGVWDTDAVLSVDRSGVTLSTNRITLHNGLGSLLVTFSGGGDFNLTATIGSLSASRPLQSLATVSQTIVSGTLSGATSLWTGVIRITNDVTVPV